MEMDTEHARRREVNQARLQTGEQMTQIGGGFSL